MAWSVWVWHVAGWERGARVSSQSVAGRSAAALGGDRWAGAAAAAAGCGLAGGADLPASAQCSSVMMTKLFVVELLLEDHNLLQLGAGHFWHFCWVLGWRRVGCTRRRAWVWTRCCHTTSAFAGLLRVLEQRVCMCSVWSCIVCAQAVYWAAVHCACALFAWVTCRWAVLTGMRGTGAWIGRAGAGRRLARRRAQRHLWDSLFPKVVFSKTRNNEQVESRLAGRLRVLVCGNYKDHQAPPAGIRGQWASDGGE